MTVLDIVLFAVSFVVSGALVAWVLAAEGESERANAAMEQAMDDRDAALLAVTALEMQIERVRLLRRDLFGDERP